MFALVAHGIGGIRDLPVPNWLFYYGAGIVLGVSFVALAVLWKRPVLQRHVAGHPLPEGLQRVLLSRALRIVLGAVSTFLLGVVFYAAAFGDRDVNQNLAPTFVYVVFWLGMVALVVVFGNVWTVLSPWRAVADAVAWAGERLGLRLDAPFAFPERLGRWPGAVLLLAFATLELAYVDPSNPRVLAVAIALYSWITWLGMATFGRRAWLEHGEAFNVYFDLLGRLAPFGRVEGRLVVRVPAAGLAPVLRKPGTVAFVAVMLGSVAFDGFSRTRIWQDRYYKVQVTHLDNPSLADLLGILMNLGGLLAAVCLVAAAYLAAVAGARAIARDRRDLANAFVGSLIPIAFVYAVAHYFSLLVLQGQVAIKLISDPFGNGWNVFHTAGFLPDFQVLTPNVIWYVQVGALLGGHVLGLVLAHDRAVALFKPPRIAVASQYPMLLLMVAYTVGGMWLLSQG
jgi:hypothetical protein